MARSSRRKNKCESSIRLFNQRPVSCRAGLLISFSAALWNRNPSVMGLQGSRHRQWGEGPPGLNALAAGFVGEHEGEPVPPEPRRLVENVYVAFS